MEAQNPAPRARRPMHPATRRSIYTVAIIALLAALGFSGVGVYKKLRHRTLMSRAQEHLARKDYGQAAMTARWALEVQPDSLDARQFLARLATEAGARDAVQLQRSVAEHEPTNPENYLQWANTALASGDLVNARMALDGMKRAGLENAAYFDARARLADAEGHPELIEPAMSDAVRLEPGNPLYRLRLASMQTGSADPEVKKRAMETIEELAKLPETRRAALRVLLHAAMVRRDGPTALAVAERLRSAPEAKREDLLAYLGIMRKAQRWEFWWALGTIQAREPDPAGITEIMRWMVRNDLAVVAADWSRRLPNEIRLRPPLAIAIAEALTLVNDWEGLRPIVRAGEWGDLDFQRRALLARVLRESGDEPGARTQWNSAVNMLGDRAESYDALLTLTRLWKWDAEQETLLWVMARGKTMPKPALEELLRRNLNRGRTADLHAIFVRLLELDPGNPEAKNNVAYTSLLLGSDKKRAEQLAADAYRADPANHGYAATYAFALHSTGKNEEGLKIMQTIPEAERKSPATALSHALLLAATGSRENARQSLALAEQGRLLPEERKLLERARAKIGAP